MICQPTTHSKISSPECPKWSSTSIWKARFRPETLLKLAKRHHVSLPATTVAELQEWYTFHDFNHFVDIYQTIASCLRDAEDIELITREFLIGQAEQNVRYSEVTYTAHTQYILNGLGFHEQMDAINRARAWASRELGVAMGIIMDIPRNVPAAAGEMIADWALARYGDGLIAFGLGGKEVGNPPRKHRTAFDKVRQAGIPCIPHAGETVGPESIWDALEVADPIRIGHGVRAIEDPTLVAYLRERQIPLEVSPTSNVCLGVYPSLESHSLPQLMAEGLYITLNSDDPPMFNTTLTNEYLACQELYGWDRATIEKLVLNGVTATLLPEEERTAMADEFRQQFAALAL